MFYCVFDAVVDDESNEEASAPVVITEQPRSVPMETEEDHSNRRHTNSNANTPMYHTRQTMHEPRDPNRMTNQSPRVSRLEDENDDGRAGSRATGIKKWFSWFNTSNRRNKSGEDIQAPDVQGESSNSRQRESHLPGQELFRLSTPSRNGGRGIPTGRDEQDYEARPQWSFPTANMSHDNVQEESRPFLCANHSISSSNSITGQRGTDYTTSEGFSLGSTGVAFMPGNQNDEEQNQNVRHSDRNSIQDSMERIEDGPFTLTSSSSNIRHLTPISKFSNHKACDTPVSSSSETDLPSNTAQPDNKIDGKYKDRGEEIPGGTISDIYALIVRTLNLCMPTLSDKTTEAPPHESNLEHSESMDVSRTSYAEYVTGKQDMNIENEFASQVPKHCTPSLHRLHTEWPKDQVNIEVLLSLKEPRNSLETLAVQEFMAKEKLSSNDDFMLIDGHYSYQDPNVFHQVSENDRASKSMVFPTESLVDSGVGSHEG